MTKDHQVKRIGLIAGGGNYPILFARAMKKRGYEVICLGVLNHADPILGEICDSFQYLGLAKFGAACRYFRKNGVTEATLAGKIVKTLLLQPGFIFQQLPDWHTFSTFLPLFFSPKSNLNSDTLLLTAVNAFETKGVHLLPATDFAPEMLLGRGLLTREPVTEQEWEDIRYVWPIAREIGRLDVGQLVAVKRKKVLAIEGIEGTDATSQRGSSLCQRLNLGEGFSLIKIGKPNQDMRFDVPTFGFGTLEMMVKTGATLLALEADRAIMIEDREALKAYAEEHGLKIIALTDQDRLSEHCPYTESGQKESLSFADEPIANREPTLAGKPIPYRLLTRRAPSRKERIDFEYGWPYSEELTAQKIGHTLLIRNRATLCAESIEGTEAVIERGATVCRGGFQVLVNSRAAMTPPEPLSVSVLDQMERAGSHFLAFDSGTEFEDRERFIQAAERKKIVLVEVTI